MSEYFCVMNLPSYLDLYFFFSPLQFTRHLDEYGESTFASPCVVLKIHSVNQQEMHLLRQTSEIQKFESNGKL